MKTRFALPVNSEPIGTWHSLLTKDHPSDEALKHMSVFVTNHKSLLTFGVCPEVRAQADPIRTGYFMHNLRPALLALQLFVGNDLSPLQHSP